MLDGFPKNCWQQAIALDKMLVSKEKSLDIVIEIKVPDEILKKRIVNRHDEAVKKVCNLVLMIMLKYSANVLIPTGKQTAPVLPYYKERKLLTPIGWHKTYRTGGQRYQSIIVANSFLSSSQFHKIVILENLSAGKFIQKPVI